MRVVDLSNRLIVKRLSEGRDPMVEAFELFMQGDEAKARALLRAAMKAQARKEALK